MLEKSIRAFMPYPFAPVKSAPVGTLAGLTFAVKDLFDVAGYPTGGGNPHILAMSGIRRNNSPVVQQLLDNGAQFIGKTHTNEMAFSMSGHNYHYGTPVNGAAPERIPGGSSSGSASAVSNQCCDFALGTDTGGSVRTPASYCGLFGIRPTHGRISLDGCQPLAESMDTCGWFARDATVFAAVGDVLLPEDTVDSASPSLAIHPALFSRLPASSQQCLLPFIDAISSTWGGVHQISAELPDVDSAYLAFRVIQGRESWQAQGETIEREGLVLGPDVAARFAWGKQVTDSQVSEAITVREQVTQWWNEQLGNRILIMPTVPDVAPLLTTSDSEIEHIRRISHDLLSIAVLTRRPQVTIPLATLQGAPLGLSLMGPCGSDRQLIRLAGEIYSLARTGR
ncbi:amidase [Mangrovibacter plantisponsor]|uniref:Amidase n=1 Tax=Mangrovibacter plantisponsor TaxID=451513 RepID=A0A317PXY1_9ENTR|nr:amidase [Mangrovibacter plantisponsor]PWW05951.1 amidase [Mangrovibacter plantisponsor]